MRRWAELVGAATLLTRLKLGWMAPACPPAACAWAYPVVGVGVGAIGAAVLAGLQRLGLPQGLAAVWALAATLLVTGGLHEDGLADTADGFGGGRDRAGKLAIMRDSRIGSYGALALGISLLLRAGALAVAQHPALALLAAGVLGRGAMLLPLLLLRPARDQGLGASVARGRGPAWAGLVLTLAAALLRPGAGLAALAAAAAATLLARAQIGGYTGDVLGATEQAAECAALSALLG